GPGGARHEQAATAAVRRARSRRRALDADGAARRRRGGGCGRMSDLLDALWDAYASHVPYARTFVHLAGGDFRNDHVAFRSLDLRPISSVFEKLGWQRAGAYDFPDAR